MQGQQHARINYAARMSRPLSPLLTRSAARLSVTSGRRSLESPHAVSRRLRPCAPISTPSGHGWRCRLSIRVGNRVCGRAPLRGGMARSKEMPPTWHVKGGRCSTTSWRLAAQPRGLRGTFVPILSRPGVCSMGSKPSKCEQHADGTGR